MPNKIAEDSVSKEKELNQVELSKEQQDFFDDQQKKQNRQGDKKTLAKETVREFLKSLLIGWIPVLLDFVFTATVIYLASLRLMGGYTFFDTFFVDSQVVPSGINAAGTAVGYFMGFVASYFLMVFFVFKHNKKGKTLKGILIYIAVEVFIYGFNVLLGTLFPMFLPYIFAFILRIVVSYIVVFLLRKFLIFMPEKPAS